VALNMADAKAPSGPVGEPPDDPNAMVMVADANGNTVMDPKTGKPLLVRNVGGSDFPTNLTPDQMTQQRRQAAQFGPPQTQPEIVWEVGPDGKLTPGVVYEDGENDVHRPGQP